LILPTLQIVNDTVKIVVKLRRVCCARPAHLFDDWIAHRGSLLQKLLGGTEYGRLVTKLTDCLLDLRAHPCIGNVPAVPSDQVFHSMDGGHGDMQRVALGLGGQRSPCKTAAGNGPGVVGDFQQRQVTQQSLTSHSRYDIAASGFLRDEWRSKDIECGSLVPPPPRYFLVSGEGTMRLRLRRAAR
jgi:hypothetical protein